MIEAVKLRTVYSNKLVDAEILDDITMKNLADWDLRWRALAISVVVTPGEKFGANVFSWYDSSLEYRKLDNYRFYSLTCNDSTEGMMIVSFREESYPQFKFPTQPTAYVDFIEVAPWNRDSAGIVRQYLGVGTALLEHAKWVSESAGFGGRLGLHSKPEAEDFYKKRGMTDLGMDVHGMRYFEYVQ